MRAVKAQYRCIIFQCTHCGNCVYGMQGTTTVSCPHCNTRIQIDFEQVQVVDSLLKAAQLTRRYNQGHLTEFIANAQRCDDQTDIEEDLPPLPDELTALFERLDRIPSSQKNMRLRQILQYLTTARDVFLIPYLATIFDEGWLEKQLQKLEHDGWLVIDASHNTLRFTGDLDHLYPLSGSVSKCRKTIKQLFSSRKQIATGELYEQLEQLGYHPTVIDQAVDSLRHIANKLTESRHHTLSWVE